ncbi:MAG: hypothetical protein RL268_19 [Pseudomonadota bacterium]
MTASNADNASKSPEVGKTIKTGSLLTNYHDAGAGKPILLLHGSGPGVTAWANWRLILPVLAERSRVIAPDLAGFGYTVSEKEVSFDIDLWMEQISALLDALKLPKVCIIGNSFGGAMALHFAAQHPERVEKIVLMGSVGTSFPLTYGLDRVWGYGGSLEEMRELIGIFAYDQSIATDDLLQLRYAASIRDDVQKRFAALFPAPRQRWIDALALKEDQLSALSLPVLLIHGVNDAVIPIESSRALSARLRDARLVEIDECGHWVQIEKTAQFIEEVYAFLDLDDNGGNLS